MFNFVYGDIDFAHKLDRASQPTEEYYKHMHPFLEILYFVEGDVYYTVESESKKLVAGDLILIAPGKYHFAEVNSKVAYERYVLKLPAAMLPDHLISRIWDMPPFAAAAKKYGFIFENLDSYYGNYSEKDLKALCLAETTKLLIFLLREPNKAAQNQVNPVIAQLIKYIDENLRSPLDIETIGNHFHFSKSYISNEFKKYMKIPIMQYVRAKKIMAAHQLIIAGEKKSKVAEMFGFENYSTFYRQYCKFIGEIPTRKS